MDFLKRQLFWFYERNRQIALQSSHLGRLPTELLEHIIDYLPPPSAALFSISCMQIKRFVRRQDLKLQSNPADLFAFLEILARDLPDHVVCPTCCKLHKIQKARVYSEKTHWRGRRPKCYDKDIYIWVRRYMGEGFSSTIFRMAMKRHGQQNPEYIQLLKLLCLGTTTYTLFGYARQSRVDCCISDGVLLHRVQQRFLSDSAFVRNPCVDICTHLMFRSNKICGRVFYKPSVDILATYESKLVWSIRWVDVTHPDTISVSSKLLRCRHCATEFQIDFKYYTGYGLAMFFTRWKDLGTGPDSDEWKQNFRLQDCLSPITCQKLGLDFRSAHVSGIPFEDEDALLQAENKRPLSRSDENPLSSAFGNGEEFKCDYLLGPQNKAKLFRMTKKYIFQCVMS